MRSDLIKKEEVNLIVYYMKNRALEGESDEYVQIWEYLLLQGRYVVKLNQDFIDELTEKFGFILSIRFVGKALSEEPEWMVPTDDYKFLYFDSYQEDGFDYYTQVDKINEYAENPERVEKFMKENPTFAENWRYPEGIPKEAADNVYNANIDAQNGISTDKYFDKWDRFIFHGELNYEEKKAY